MFRLKSILIYFFIVFFTSCSTNDPTENVKSVSTKNATETIQKESQEPKKEEKKESEKAVCEQCGKEFRKGTGWVRVHRTYLKGYNKNCSRACAMRS